MEFSTDDGFSPTVHDIRDRELVKGFFHLPRIKHEPLICKHAHHPGAKVNEEKYLIEDWRADIMHNYAHPLRNILPHYSDLRIEHELPRGVKVLTYFPTLFHTTCRNDQSILTIGTPPDES